MVKVLTACLLLFGSVSAQSFMWSFGSYKPYAKITVPSEAFYSQFPTAAVWLDIIGVTDEPSQYSIITSVTNNWEIITNGYFSGTAPTEPDPNDSDYYLDEQTYYDDYDQWRLDMQTYSNSWVEPVYGWVDYTNTQESSICYYLPSGQYTSQITSVATNALFFYRLDTYHPEYGVIGSQIMSDSYLSFGKVFVPVGVDNMWIVPFEKFKPKSVLFYAIPRDIGGNLITNEYGKIPVINCLAEWTDVRPSKMTGGRVIYSDGVPSSSQHLGYPELY